MPDPQLAEVAQAQHVGEAERVRVVPLKLVPVGRLLQGQGPTVPILPKDDDEHIGISARTWECRKQGLWILASPKHSPPALASVLGGARRADGQVQGQRGQG